MITRGPDAYFEALDRLKNGRPLRVVKGTKISNDAVALEAGRGRGSIKKSRGGYHELITAIEEAAVHQGRSKEFKEASVARHKSVAENYRQLWEQSLAREISLIYELENLKREVARAHTEKVLNLRSR